MSKGFAILLAFLGANILCAATIRFPWKKRQTGFVITHAGLLVLLAGSWYALMTSDEGQVAALENEVKSELVRRDYPVVRVRQLDPKDPHRVDREWELPFRPGSFPWGPGQPKPKSAFALLNPANWVSQDDEPFEVLTKEGDPFRLVARSHIPASIPAIKHVADPSGTPMVKIRPLFKAPRMTETRDLFADEEERWFASDDRVFKVVREVNPAQFTFYYVDRPELVEDFLNPAVGGTDGVARFRYEDLKGSKRTYDWALDEQGGKTITLPDSDLSVKFLDLVAFPAAEAGLGRMLGAKTIPIAEFEVKKGDAPPVKHFALAALPMFPNVIPTAQTNPGAPPPRALVSINYDLPPVVDPKLNGLFGVVEVLGTPDGKLFSRVWGRPEDGKGRAFLRSKGPLKLGESTVAFGGNPNLPMTLSFAVEDYLVKGIEAQVCEPFALPPNQMGEGIPASLVEMTVLDDNGKEQSKEFYIRRSNSLDQLWQPVTIGDQRFEICYDADRKPLGFDLKLVDFDRGFDPGTEQAARFQSDVLLTDKPRNIKDRPYRISMNEPLTHKGYTFYQSSYIREQTFDRGWRPAGSNRSCKWARTPAGTSSTLAACWSASARSSSSTCERACSPTAASARPSATRRRP
ncbi:MAG: cytochrome c biogenesis protein ResB [Isosphaeraceae bacterium]